MHHKDPLVTIIALLERLVQQQERIIDIMTTDFQSILTQVQGQGTELDKILAEVQAGNTSVVTPDQLQSLKDQLDANQTKLQAIDALHPDTPAAPPSDGSGASGSSGDAGSSGSSASTGDAGSSAASGSTGDASSSGASA